jgi:hypothetical protein
MKSMYFVPWLRWGGLVFELGHLIVTISDITMGWDIVGYGQLGGGGEGRGAREWGGGIDLGNFMDALFTIWIFTHGHYYYYDKHSIGGDAFYTIFIPEKIFVLFILI